MSVRIAIPVPSSDEEYNGRTLLSYIEALQAAGGTAEVLALNADGARVAALLDGVDGVLLPGSRFDVDPALYGEARIPECGEADPARTVIDELIFRNAFDAKMPVLAICHGVQSLNVWRGGSLVQDIEAELKTEINHQPGRDVVEAHAARIAEGSRLAAMLASGVGLEAQVNSSHHQAIRVAGSEMRVTAVSPADGVVEAVELDSPEHFVVGVQWHPERTYQESMLSRAIFGAFVGAARNWRAKLHEAEPVSR